MNIDLKETYDTAMAYLLTPASWIYGAVTFVRNKLYELGILKSVEFEVPVVSVGNITVGGTGKTPHVEYLIRRLCCDYNIGVLSRGYKRRTKGFVMANHRSTPETIGDEPYQIYEKFGSKVAVAVCEKRADGIREMLREKPDIDLILLDDAYQHLAVKPKVSILLIDYNRPIWEDNLLPLGRLRESASGVNRSDIVVLTKCPEEMTPLDVRIVNNNLNLMTYQKLLFSRYIYKELQPVFSEEAKYDVSLSCLTRQDTVLLLTGIANPREFVRYFKQFQCKVKVLHYPDHHDFSRRDIEQIEKTFKTVKGARKILVTTEKDAVRLSNNPYFPFDLKPYSFYLPISVSMDENYSDGNFVQILKEAIEDKGLIPDMRN